MCQKYRNDESFVLSSQFDDEDSKNYDIVTFDVRVELIKLVCEQKFKISQAARALHVNQSTAKYIIRSFRQSGKILKKSQKDSEISQRCMKQIKKLQQKIKNEQRIQDRSLKLKMKNARRTQKKKSERVECQQNKISAPLESSETEERKALQSAQLENGVEQSSNMGFYLVPILINPFSCMMWGSVA